MNLKKNEKLSKQLAKLCQLEQAKTDKNTLRKIARDIWDTIVDIFTDSTTQSTSSKRSTQSESLGASSVPYDASNTSSFISKTASSSSTSSSVVTVIRDTQLAYFNRELVRQFFILIKNRLAKTIIISLLATLYNIADTSANNEIFSEYRHLWPSSLATTSSLNTNSLTDTVLSILAHSLSDVSACNSHWLCTHADICLARSYHSDAIKYLLEMFACETKYFFKAKLLVARKKAANAADQPSSLHMDDRFIDKNVKSLIKSCGQLNKHTQAALFCQFLNNNDYTNAFR